MTEQEAIEELSNEIRIITDMISYCRNFEDESDIALAYLIKEKDATEMAIIALKEIQQYREIGTMEECREAVEKQKSEAVKNKKLLIGFPRRPYCIQGDCPKCGCKEIKATDTDYCYECGQHLKWDN